MGDYVELFLEDRLYKSISIEVDGFYTEIDSNGFDLITTNYINAGNIILTEIPPNNFTPPATTMSGI